MGEDWKARKSMLILSIPEWKSEQSKEIIYGKLQA